MRLSILGLLLATSVVGCSTDRVAGDAAADTGMDSASGDSASGDSARPDTGPALTCAEVGGTCGCAGSCDPGTHEAPASWGLCPQPCDDCGGCSQGCCVPDDAGVSDAAADGAADAASDASGG